MFLKLIGKARLHCSDIAVMYVDDWVIVSVSALYGASVTAYIWWKDPSQDVGLVYLADNFHIQIN